MMVFGLGMRVGIICAHACKIRKPCTMQWTAATECCESFLDRKIYEEAEWYRAVRCDKRTLLKEALKLNVL